MAIRRINVAVTEEVLQILNEYQKEKGLITRDSAIEMLILDWKKKGAKKA